MTVLAVLTVLKSTLPSFCLSYKVQCQEMTVTVLTVLAVSVLWRFRSWRLPPLNSGKFPQTSAYFPVTWARKPGDIVQKDLLTWTLLFRVSFFGWLFLLWFVGFNLFVRDENAEFTESLFVHYFRVPQKEVGKRSSITSFVFGTLSVTFLDNFLMLVSLFCHFFAKLLLPDSSCGRVTLHYLNAQAKGSLSTVITFTYLLRSRE